MAFLPALPDPAVSPLPGLLAARGGGTASDGSAAGADFAALLAALRGEAGRIAAAPGTAPTGSAQGAPATSQAPRALRATLLESAAGLTGEAVRTDSAARPAPPAETLAMAATGTEPSADTGAVPPDSPADSPAETPPDSPPDSQETLAEAEAEPEAPQAPETASPYDSPAPSERANAEAAATPDRAPAPSSPPTPASPAPDGTEDTDGDAAVAVDVATDDGRAMDRDPVEFAAEVASAAANAGAPAAPPRAATPARSDAEPDAPETVERAARRVNPSSATDIQDVAARTPARAEAASANPTAAAERPTAPARGPELPLRAADAAREAVAAAAPASESATRPLPATASSDSGETIQPTASTARADVPSAAAAVARGDAPPAPPPARASDAGEVSLVLARAAADGQRQITIRMHPAELGKIEVRLDFGSDGALKAAIRADTPEALDLLQRDVRLLERALSDAGFRQGQTSLDFSLGGEARQQAQGHGPAGSGRPDGQGAGGETELDAAALAELADRRAAAGGIDIVI